MDIQTLLCDVIKSKIEDLNSLEVGSDEYKATVDTITKFTDRAIDLEKIDVESEDKKDSREQAKTLAEKELDLKKEQFEEEKERVKLDYELKKQQIQDGQKGQLINNCISIAGIVVPVLVTIWGTKKSFEFEKEGTITTIMGRGFINKLLPRK